MQALLVVKLRKRMRLEAQNSTNRLIIDLIIEQIRGACV